MPLPDDLILSHHISVRAVELMDELCEVYADAYGAVPGEGIGKKSSAFRERASAAARGANWRAIPKPEVRTRCMSIGAGRR